MAEIIRAGYERMGMSLSTEAQVMHEPYVSAARTEIGDTRFEAAREVGQAMSLEEAIAYALEESD